MRTNYDDDGCIRVPDEPGRLGESPHPLTVDCLIAMTEDNRRQSYAALANYFIWLSAHPTWGMGLQHPPPPMKIKREARHGLAVADKINKLLNWFLTEK